MLVPGALTTVSPVLAFCRQTGNDDDKRTWFLSDSYSPCNTSMHQGYKYEACYSIQSLYRNIDLVNQSTKDLQPAQSQYARSCLATLT